MTENGQLINKTFNNLLAKNNNVSSTGEMAVKLPTCTISLVPILTNASPVPRPKKSAVEMIERLEKTARNGS